MHLTIYEGIGRDTELVYTTSTKTQYAGFDAHVALIKLLRYLKKKYFTVFEMNDEGMYWETDDLDVLRSQFDKYEYAINSLTAALNKMPRIQGESAVSLADRIEEIFKKQLGTRNNKEKDT